MFYYKAMYDQEMEIFVWDVQPITSIPVETKDTSQFRKYTGNRYYGNDPHEEIDLVELYLSKDDFQCYFITNTPLVTTGGMISRVILLQTLRW